MLQRSSRGRWLHRVGVGALAAASILLATAGSATSGSAAPGSSAPGGDQEALYLALNDAAMAKMMTAMTVMPSGVIDRDFAATMIPHHQGAIDMALAELRYGTNEQLRRIAQEIIVDQQDEIVAMRRVVGEAPMSGARSASQLAAADSSAPDSATPASLPTASALSASAISSPPPGADDLAGSVAQSNIPMSHRDRVYAAEQYSNTVSVIDPVDNRVLGVIRLGDPKPSDLSPLYKGQVLVHGMGFSPDHRTLAVVSIGSNSVTFIDTATNAIRHVTYVGRSPHETFFTPDGTEVWVTVRGEDYVAVLDGHTYEEKVRIKVPAGPGMQIFSPDGKYGYVCSSFNPDTVVIAVADHTIVGHVPQASPFCPNIAATPDGKQVWLTLKDTGKVEVFDAHPPFSVLKTFDAGPITNHVNFVRTSRGQFAYVTVGGLNQVKVFRTDDFSQVATIDVGDLPHGIWPSGDGSRIYVGLENADAMVAIDTDTNRVIASSPIGQAPQAIAYVPNAVPDGKGDQGLQPLGIAGQSVQLSLVSTQAAAPNGVKSVLTRVSLFDQGLLQVLQAAVTGLQPKSPYVLALSARSDGSGSLQPLANFMTNPAGAAVVDAVGPIRQIVRGEQETARRYLVIVPSASMPAATGQGGVGQGAIGQSAIGPHATGSSAVGSGQQAQSGTAVQVQAP